MKIITKLIALAFISFFAVNVNAQYSSSAAYLTVNSAAEIREDGSVGAVSNGRNIAISRQYVIFGTGKCHRDLRYFDVSGNLLAQSDPYSHDHGSFTKIIFDPNNENIVYALFTERKAHAYLPEPDEDAPRYTYLRRFVKSGSTVLMSDKYAVFENNNPSDFVIASNGDLLVGNVRADGAVFVRPVRWAGSWTSSPKLMVSYPNEARRASGAPSPYVLWPISMDMKGNTFLIAHNRGYFSDPNHYIKIKKGLYHPSTQTASTIYTYYIQGKSLYGGGGIAAGPGSVLRQSVALKTDGSVMYISRPAYNSNEWHLNSMTAAGANTLVESGNGYHANVVVTNQDKTFFAANNLADVFHISLYSEIAGLEYTYTPANEILNDLENLAVQDCNLLATGQLNNNYQYHQFFTCSDCNGEINAAGHFEGQFVDRTIRTYYGNQEVAVFCSPEDVIFNGLASTCEEGYHLSVAPINVDTWVTEPALFSDWVCTACTAPSDIHIADYAGSLDYDQYYLLSFTVSAGGISSVIYRLFRIEHCGRQGGEAQDNFDKANLQDFATTIYPNPSNGNFTIQTNSTELSEYEITDITGRLIQEGQFQMSTEIDVNNSPTGIYFVTIRNELGEEVSKLILQ